MRIIDKNYDFYDYLHDPSDNLVFDRRNSFLLTKEIVCDKIAYLVHHGDSRYRFLLLHCGSTFWLFLLNITEVGIIGAKDYDLELLTSWKDYDAPRELISFKSVTFPYTYGVYLRRVGDTDDKLYDRIKDSVNRLRDAIRYNDYTTEEVLSVYKVSTYVKNVFVEKTYDIPLLTACGVSEFISPIDIFTAIEEYFSMEKTASETTEPLGVTDDDKIVMHGFDTKTSFRGKNK